MCGNNESYTICKVNGLIYLCSICFNKAQLASFQFILRVLNFFYRLVSLNPLQNWLLSVSFLTL